MSWDEKVVVIIYAVMGAGVGALVFFFTLGGIDLLAGKSTAWWNGWPGLFLSGCFGGLVGAVSYKFRDKEFAAPEVDLDPYGGRAGGELLMRRLGVILGAVVAIYFLWQMAKSV
jgi:hypothetical protein